MGSKVYSGSEAVIWTAAWPKICAITIAAIDHVTSTAPIAAAAAVIVIEDQPKVFNDYSDDRSAIGNSLAEYGTQRSVTVQDIT